MLVMILVVLIFPILTYSFCRIMQMISYINGKMDVGLVAIVFSAIALFMKMAPQKDVIAKVPWNTIIMICGVGMLINVAIEAGTH